ncbi:MAG: ATPase [Deltaproteobacteria bacterium]|nr:ATPase [Deltaproteobacteria bacterium]
MGEFYGRMHELAGLAALTKKSTASLVAVTGRRRNGKSRLIEEFARRSRGYRFLALSALAPEPDVTEAMQRDAIASSLERTLKIPPIAHANWSDVLAHIAYNTKKGRWIVLLDEVSWMAQRDPAFLGRLKTAWDQLFKQNDQLILVLCSSVSSWIEKNLLSSTGFVGRVSWSLRLEQLPLEHSALFPGLRSATHSAYDILKMLAVTGGVPKYLEELLGEMTAEQNIRRLCFQPEGLLFNEFDHIFHTLFEGRSDLYRRIVTALVATRLDLGGVCDALGNQKSGVISSYLDDLVMAGFLAKDPSWELRTGKTKRQHLYRIRDNYLRFFLRYVDPRRSEIEEKRFGEKPLETLRGWDSMLGLQFENLVLQNRRFVWSQCGLTPGEVAQDGPFFQTPTTRRSGCQVDYLIQTTQGPIFLCEIKFHRGEVRPKVIADVQEKLHKLVKPRHTSIFPVLIHVGGVSPKTLESGFFSHVIDFREALGGAGGARRP